MAHPLSTWLCFLKQPNNAIWTLLSMLILTLVQIKYSFGHLQ